MAFFSKNTDKDEEFYIQLLSAFNEPAAIYDKKGNFQYANNAFENSFSKDKIDIVFTSLIPNDVNFRIAKAVRNIKEINETIDGRTIQIRPIGSQTIVKIIANENLIPVKANIASINPKDLETEIASINEVPQVSKANLASLIAGAPFGMARLSGRNLENSQIIGTNSAFVRITGIDSGADIKTIVKEEDYAKLEKIKIGQSIPIEVQIKNAPHPLCEAWLVEDGEKASALLLIDITERREMEGRLTQANKMEVIGKIASEVAHELNNLLAVIVLNTDTLLMRHPVGDPSYHELQGIRNTTGRAANLVHSLLAFSRKQTFRRDVVDIGEVLSEFSFLLHQVLDERVKFDIHYGRDLPHILADKQQLETMFMNLVTNARDAVISGGKKDGFVKVTTKKANKADVVKSIKTNVTIDIPDTEFVEISVSDNGTGMSPEIAAKIFEPFFTTKETGKGTGIGMASVYGIVKQSGGFIGLESEIGVGTTFSVFLPKTEEVAKTISPAPAENAPVKRANNLSGQGRILLVEDEDGLRLITAQILRQRGYIVVEAGDGEEAYEILEAEPNSFDLLITDVVMPIMDGPTLLKEAKQFLGDARVIFMSGYAEQDFGAVLEKDRAISFLPKPFELVQLAERVKAELSGI